MYNIFWLLYTLQCAYHQASFLPITIQLTHFALSYPSSTLITTTLFSISMLLLLFCSFIINFIFHILKRSSSIYLSLSDISFNRIPSSPSTLLQIATIFLCLSSIPLHIYIYIYIYTPHLLYLSINGQVSCFHISAIVNNAVNTGIHIIFSN